MARDRALHIGIYGRMNAGKSSLLNRLTDQQAAIVSETPGTTTDLVRRSFEIAGLGPVVFLDTAGIDDTESELGRMRIEKTRQSLEEIDLAIMLLSGKSADSTERAWIENLENRDLPYLVFEKRTAGIEREKILESIREAAEEIKDRIPSLFGDRKIGPGSIVLFVCPLDSAAPAGRLILPQVQALRAALDRNAVGITVQPPELRETLSRFPQPDLIVTDSQIFGQVAGLVPDGVELTSFSALLAEQKGDRLAYEEGLTAINNLKSGDRILIIENCSHQYTCEDIGRVKIPGWLRDYTNIPDLTFDFGTGRDPLPEDLSSYTLAVQCGGCVSTRRMIQNRIRAIRNAGVPITNYGMLIRKLQKV